MDNKQLLEDNGYVFNEELTERYLTKFPENKDKDVKYYSLKDNKTIFIVTDKGTTEKLIGEALKRNIVMIEYVKQR